MKPFSDDTPAQTVFTFFSDPIVLLFAAGMAIGVLKRHLEGRLALCLYYGSRLHYLGRRSS